MDLPKIPARPARVSQMRLVSAIAAMAAVGNQVYVEGSHARREQYRGEPPRNLPPVKLPPADLERLQKAAERRVRRAAARERQRQGN